MVKQFVLLFIALNTFFISSSFAKSTIIHSEFLTPLAKQIYTYTDTLKADTFAIPTVQIKGYLVPQILHKTTASIGLISKNTLFAQPSHQMVHAFNTVPGVRMEERSPGSYRLSIRGSLLRSPFGIRNIKVYLDEMPLTDAGGNTYLNLIDPVFLSNIEVLKGPDGSVFGANSGGAVLLNTTQATDYEPKEITFQAQGGAYGLYHQQVGFKSKVSEKYSVSIQHAFQRSDGYRSNSSLQKWFFHTRQNWQYAAQRELLLQLLYTDLGYQTPGGLNLAQYQTSPKSSRPATPATPSASEQKAAIYNQTGLGGLTHKWQFSENLSHQITFFGSSTDFKNPFITNYEIRDEQNGGWRTFLRFDEKMFFGNQARTDSLTWGLLTGLEWQLGDYSIRNYDNNGGTRGAAQGKDHFSTKTKTSFLKSTLRLNEFLQVEASISYNEQQHRLKELESLSNQAPSNNIKSRNWMPRVATSIQINPILQLRASLSKGFSPPTISELRPSDQLINDKLFPEWGWNREVGMRLNYLKNAFYLDLTAFNYRLNNAIVRRTRENGAEYFTNAGKTNQSGVEVSIHSKTIDWNAALLTMNFEGSYVYSDFKFKNFISQNQDFSNYALTGVPMHQFHAGMRLNFNKAWNLWTNYQFTSKIPLNDANEIWAQSYHLLNAKVNWSTSWSSKRTKTFNLFFGAENLLNVQYSLGNDINAFGARYFNAAPLRNFYAGIRFQIL